MGDWFRLRMRRSKGGMKERDRLEFYIVERLRYILLLHKSLVWDIVVDNERFFMVRSAIRGWRRRWRWRWRWRW